MTEPAEFVLPGVSGPSPKPAPDARVVWPSLAELVEARTTEPR